MNAKEKIYETLKKAGGEFSAVELSELAGVHDRPYTSKKLAELLQEKRVRQRREGRRVFYWAVDGVVALEENLVLTGLKEDEVWQKVRDNQQFMNGLTERAENALYFGFTEMLNNAIDHSRSGVGYVRVAREQGQLTFIVRDKGIGVFRNVMQKKHLADEVEAIREIIKGKTTTAPRWHSGEGIFWTSKIADRLTITSYEYRLIVDTLIDDYAIERLEEPVVGTEVRFVIAAETEKSLQKIFREYSTSREALGFDTTMVPVRLYESGDVWISRSQAKRVLRGLEKYKKVIFDFKGIPVVGQGFADEIFRVFRLHHPEIILEPINMSESVELMVKRALRDTTGQY